MPGRILEPGIRIGIGEGRVISARVLGDAHEQKNVKPETDRSQTRNNGDGVGTSCLGMVIVTAMNLYKNIVMLGVAGSKYCSQ